MCTYAINQVCKLNYKSIIMTFNWGSKQNAELQIKFQCEKVQYYNWN